ncbi:MAG: diguanylate cyclase [Myxococcota bacterium]
MTHDSRPEPIQDTALPTVPGRGTVLIIEPDNDVAKALENHLTQAGYDILVAETGHGGQYLADQQQVDLVLLDRGLGDASSIDLLRELRSSPHPCEVIMMTADPTIEIFVEALDAGAFDLLVKPFSHLTLVTAKINNAVTKVQAERARDKLASLLQAFRQTEQRPSSATGTLEVPGPHSTTQLPNRAAAEIRFAEETSRALRYNRPLAVVLISIDKIDSVLEIAGSATADAVMQKVAEIVHRQIRNVDYLAHRQGGELILLLPETLKGSGVVVAERIRISVSEAIFSGPSGVDDMFRLTASFGVAGLPTDTMNAELLRQAAEVALVRAQTTGNAVCSYESTHRRSS